MKSKELIGKKVVIAPFSTNAIFLYHRLIHDGAEVVAFLDKDYSLHNSSYKGTMIIPYFHFAQEEITAIIAKPGFIKSDKIIYDELVAADYNESEILKQDEIEFCCDIKAIKQNIDLDGLSKIRNIEWMSILKRKLYEYTVENGFSVEAVHLVVTTRCSLKCKGCCYLMDYFYPKDQKDINLEATIQCFDLLMGHLDFVDDVIPIGGEPFLNKELDKLLLHLASSKYTKKIGKFTIITNGTVLPNKATLEILGAYQNLFEVLLTDYGKKSVKRLNLVSLLNEYGCFYKNFINDVWYKTNQPTTPPIGLNMDDVNKKCSKCACHLKGRLRIVGNKIYSCPFVAFAAECHAIPNDKRDYLDINRDEITRERLRMFEREIHPGMAYCGSPMGQNKETNILIPVGEQTSSVAECVRYE